MTDHKLKRLLWLATQPANHKPFYAQYCQLMYNDPPLVGWCLGGAFITPAGESKLKELNKTP